MMMINVFSFSPHVGFLFSDDQLDAVVGLFFTFEDVHERWCEMMCSRSVLSFSVSHISRSSSWTTHGPNHVTRTHACMYHRLRMIIIVLRYRIVISRVFSNVFNEIQQTSLLVWFLWKPSDQTRSFLLFQYLCVWDVEIKVCVSLLLIWRNTKHMQGSHKPKTCTTDLQTVCVCVCALVCACLCVLTQHGTKCLIIPLVLRLYLRCHIKTVTLFSSLILNVFLYIQYII